MRIREVEVVAAKMRSSRMGHVRNTDVLVCYGKGALLAEILIDLWIVSDKLRVCFNNGQLFNVRHRSSSAAIETYGW